MTHIRSFGIALPVLLAHAATAGAWIVQKDDAPHQNFLHEVVADAAGDAIACGDLGGGRIVKFDGDTGAESWSSTMDEALALAVDGANDVVVGGAESSDFAVAKLDGATGADVWRELASVLGSSQGRVSDVALDAGGNVVAAGRLASRFAVVEHDGASGAQVWVRGINGTSMLPTSDTLERAAAVVIDGNDDVIAAGALVNDVSGLDMIVAKLDGDTGAELWRREIDIEGGASDVAVDAAGDVAVVGSDAFPGEAVVYKLDGLTGGDVWVETIATVGSTADVAFDGDGHVIVSGSVDDPVTDHDFLLVKYDGTSGDEIWRRQIAANGPPQSDTDTAIGHVVDASGDVYAVGAFSYEFSRRDFAVLRFDGATGAEVWRQEIDGTLEPDDFDNAITVALDGAGGVFAGGSIDDEDTDTDWLVVKLDTERGSLGALGGRSLVVRDPGSPTKRSFRFELKDELASTPQPGSQSDPTSAGATVRIVNPTTLEEAVFAVPPGPGWKGLGKPAGINGYQYKAPAGQGPCTSIVARPRRTLKASCSAKSGAIPFTLDEASQGSLSVSVQLGDSGAQCGTFGGFVVKDEPGVFQAKLSPGDGSTCP